MPDSRFHTFREAALCACHRAAVGWRTRLNEPVQTQQTEDTPVDGDLVDRAARQLDPSGRGAS